MRKTPYYLGFACTSALASPALAATIAESQNRAPIAAGAPRAEEEEAPASGEILVTARRRAEVERDIPVSMATIGGKQLAEAKIVQLQELTTLVPSLNISYASTSPFVQIRGFGTGNNPSFNQAVGKFIDNVSYGLDQDTRLPLFDIERVEVLRGPQVLLYGNSTTAGALNITTRKPGNEIAADISAAYEFNANEFTTQGGITLPITANVALRLSGIYQNLAKGWIYNRLTDRNVPTTKTSAGRAILQWDPGDGLEVTLKAEHDRLRNRGFRGEVIAQVTSGAYRLPDVTEDGVISVNNNVAPFFATEFNSLNNTTIQGDVSYNVFGGKIAATTGYRDVEYASSAPSSTPVPLLNAFLNYTLKQFSQELRYNGKFGVFDLTVGGFYQLERFKTYSAIDFNLAALGRAFPAFSGNGTLNQRSNSYSVFADTTVQLTKHFSLEVGGRFTRNVKTADQALVAGNVLPNRRFGDREEAISPNAALTSAFSAVYGVPPHVYNNLRLTENHFQPQIVAQYKFGPNQVYAKYVKGDKAGGFDYLYQGVAGNVTPAGAQFDSEKAQSWEVGLKGLAFDRKLDFSLAAFRTIFTDLQASTLVVSGFLVTNVGEARSEGFEAQATFTPIKGLRFTSAVTYANARYVDYPGVPCTRAQRVAKPVGCSQDLSGQPIALSSKWNGSFGIDYETLVGAYFMSANAFVLARSKYNYSTNNEPLQAQSAFATVDARLSLSPENKRWNIALFGRNLTNKKIGEYGATVAGLTGALNVQKSRGRQLGISANLKM